MDKGQKNILGVLVPDLIEIDIPKSTTNNENNPNQIYTVPFVNCIVKKDVDSSSLSSYTDTSSSGWRDTQSDIKSSQIVKHNVNAINNLATTSGSNGNIGSICVEGSSDVLFGSKTFFTGPVVIKHFVVDKNNVQPNQTKLSDNVPKAWETQKKKSRCGTKGSFLSYRLLLSVAIIISILLIITTFIFVGHINKQVLTVSQEITNRPTTTNVLSSRTMPATSTTFLPTASPTFPPSESMESDYQYVNRSQWQASSPLRTPVPLILPIKRVIIAHTVTEMCSGLDSCDIKIQAIQRHHIRNGKFDIGLNFLVGGNGLVYEGGGYNVGNHTSGYDTTSICISFIGNFTDQVAPERLLKAARSFIVDEIKSNRIDQNYLLYGHSQLKATFSPGEKLYEEIMSWSHWSERVIKL